MDYGNHAFPVFSAMGHRSGPGYGDGCLWGVTGGFTHIPTGGTCPYHASYPFFESRRRPRRSRGARRPGARPRRCRRRHRGDRTAARHQPRPGRLRRVRPTPMWQTNNTVWALAVSQRRRLRRRPVHPGPSAGRRGRHQRDGPHLPGRVQRQHRCAHHLVQPARSTARSTTSRSRPTAPELYVVGNFTTVDGHDPQADRRGQRPHRRHDHRLAGQRQRHRGRLDGDHTTGSTSAATSPRSRTSRKSRFAKLSTTQRQRRPRLHRRPRRPRPLAIECGPPSPPGPGRRQLQHRQRRRHRRHGLGRPRHRRPGGVGGHRHPSRSTSAAPAASPTSSPPRTWPTSPARVTRPAATRAPTRPGSATEPSPGTAPASAPPRASPS